MLVPFITDINTGILLSDRLGSDLTLWWEQVKHLRLVTGAGPGPGVTTRNVRNNKLLVLPDLLIVTLLSFSQL